MKTPSRRVLLGLATLAVGSLALAGCSTGDPLAEDTGDTTGASQAIVVGSQAYYSNEIIAEIYAQALERAGLQVERQFNIGQRDAYMPQLENGSIDVMPEYTGNLLQFFEPETTVRAADEVYAALDDALPEGLTVLEMAEASDQDSYTVTADFAQEHGLVSIADLADVDEPLTLGGPPELAERPYGPSGLAGTYGVEVDFSATGDTTVEDLVAGTVNVANVFTADPRIHTENLVVLEDPESLFLASNVVPVVGEAVAGQVADAINRVSARLSADTLVELNVQSTVDQQSAATIAGQWLDSVGITG
ncbi:ABC transporter substrate-binding protein [Glutamicibacter sp. MNS18]|uniref:ABC transporter substrate-binding protein n=1 Tax=Glutamicibacter sp. MNS18 TaxID=2989817 RepID=UPI002235A50B|nr:ABC transporter substrate-binding protein [Glutamicibacter sp. MNS18]MCW4465329.1 ABC transporter substrate-binding protein [Glutamicibacter sp. MNS18]